MALASGVSAGQRVVILTLSDSIQPASLRYLERGLATADATGAALTIIDLNTPGGLLSSLRQMTTAITAARRPVVVYVTPSGAQAASAGFFLLIAADVAAMAPGTNAGAAHPVAGEGAELSKTMAEKVTNDAAALIRSLATQRGRSSEWAEKAVRESLSYTEREALDKKLIDVVALDRAELLKWLNGRTVKRFDGHEETISLPAPEIVRIDPSAGDKLLSAIAHPNVAYLLLLLGMVGIYFELSHPGAVLPGVLGGISVLLALFALSVLPVNYVGVLLIVLGIVFFVLEVKVASYGLLTTAGLVSFVLGSLMLIRSPFPALAGGPRGRAADRVRGRVHRDLPALPRPPQPPREAAHGRRGPRRRGRRGRRGARPGREGVRARGVLGCVLALARLRKGGKVHVVRVVGKRLEVEPAGAAPRPGEGEG